MSELLNCPFCDGSNVKTFGPYGWYRQWGISHSCKMFYSGAQEMAQGFPSEAAAIAAWNTRATSTAEILAKALEERDVLIAEMIGKARLMCTLGGDEGGWWKRLADEADECRSTLSTYRNQGGDK